MGFEVGSTEVMGLEEAATAMMGVNRWERGRCVEEMRVSFVALRDEPQTAQLMPVPLGGQAAGRAPTMLRWATLVP